MSRWRKQWIGGAIHDKSSESFGHLWTAAAEEQLAEEQLAEEQLAEEQPAEEQLAEE